MKEKVINSNLKLSSFGGLGFSSRFNNSSVMSTSSLISENKLDFSKIDFNVVSTIFNERNFMQPFGNEANTLINLNKFAINNNLQQNHYS